MQTCRLASFSGLPLPLNLPLIDYGGRRKEFFPPPLSITSTIEGEEGLGMSYL